MNAFQKLLLAHLILDYPLQGEFLALIKAKNNFLLLTHATIWALGMCFVLDLLHIYQHWMFWWMLIGHLFMDWMKCHILPGWIDEGSNKLRLQHSNLPWVKDNLGLALWIDQAWHLGQILVCLKFASL